MLKAEEGACFIGTIERMLDGWRAKWLHTQATARGFSSIELRRQS
jgi:hypothetical protein